MPKHTRLALGVQFLQAWATSLFSITEYAWPNPFKLTGQI